MSIQSTIQCPDCGSPIVIDSILLLSGHNFKCSNSQCGVSISLSQDDHQKVADAFQQYESLKQESINIAKEGQSQGL